MKWDKPLDIKKNSDGTYVRRGKTLDQKPRWTVGTPRGILAASLLLLLLLWLQFEWVLINAYVSVAGIIVLFSFVFLQFYLARLSWEKF